MKQVMRRIERSRALKFHASIRPMAEVSRKRLQAYFSAPPIVTKRSCRKAAAA